MQKIPACKHPWSEGTPKISCRLLSMRCIDAEMVCIPAEMGSNSAERRGMQGDPTGNDALASCMLAAPQEYCAVLITDIPARAVCAIEQGASLAELPDSAAVSTRNAASLAAAHACSKFTA